MLVADIAAVVSPVDHKYESKPASAVSVPLWPAQKLVDTGEMPGLGVADTLTVTALVEEPVQPYSATVTE